MFRGSTPHGDYHINGLVAACTRKEDGGDAAVVADNKQIFWGWNKQTSGAGFKGLYHCQWGVQIWFGTWGVGPKMETQMEWDLVWESQTD